MFFMDIIVPVQIEYLTNWMQWFSKKHFILNFYDNVLSSYFKKKKRNNKLQYIFVVGNFCSNSLNTSLKTERSTTAIDFFVEKQHV